MVGIQQAEREQQAASNGAGPKPAKKGAKVDKGSKGAKASKGDKVPATVSSLSNEELDLLSTRRGLELLLAQERVSPKAVARALTTVRYEQALRDLQVELVKLQRAVQEEGRRVAILFEGRDAAGKGGTIRRFTEHLSPRSFRVVALPKPTEAEKGQWYFQRYAQQLPNPGEIVFFDRSWYNRAVVEPVMGFCTPEQHQTFLQQVPEFEHMLYEDGLELVKFWFSISKEEQAARFASRRTDPLKQWKLSPVDEQAQLRWDDYTRFKEQMFSRTHTSFAPWTIVRADNKKRARIEGIRYVLEALPYEGKGQGAIELYADPDIVVRFHRAGKRID